MAEVYSVTAVRAQLRRFLAGEISRRDLGRWLEPFVLAEEEGPRTEALDLAWDIELVLMEATHVDLTEEEVREELLPLARARTASPT